jgi:hypothetical protein
LYGKLRDYDRGFSFEESEANKRATNIGLSKTSNFLYTMLVTGFIPFLFFLVNMQIPIAREISMNNIKSDLEISIQFAFINFCEKTKIKNTPYFK